MSDINGLDLWASCKFDLNTELEALEAVRLALIEDLIPKKELGWPWEVGDVVVNQPLKFVLTTLLYPG